MIWNFLTASSEGPTSGSSYCSCDFVFLIDLYDAIHYEITATDVLCDNDLYVGLSKCNFAI